MSSKLHANMFYNVSYINCIYSSTLMLKKIKLFSLLILSCQIEYESALIRPRCLYVHMCSWYGFKSTYNLTNFLIRSYVTWYWSVNFNLNIFVIDSSQHKLVAILINHSCLLIAGKKVEGAMFYHLSLALRFTDM